MAARKRRKDGSHWKSAPIARHDFRHPGRPAPVSIVGAHGGAGTSTVARLLGAIDLGRRWPVPGDGHPGRVVAVARTNADGLAAACTMLGEFRVNGYPAGTHLVGFVLIADAPGRLPSLLARRITLLASATMVYRVPWVKVWRLSGAGTDRETVAPLITGLRLFAERAAMATTPALQESTGGFTCNSMSQYGI